MYIGATAERITPRPEDFEPRNLRAASAAIIDAANLIFDTGKFSMLRTINLTRGVGNEAFVLSLGGNPHTYHSEKHFSLGELCVLKLLRLLKEASNNSMIIVDELEMALHPRAQVKLLQYLEEQARVKSLTVIFSTHSLTLLKSIDRRRIIYLEKQDDGEIKPIVGCFPTYAIGNIASDEETLPDIVLYVEDVFARDALTAFFEKFADEHFSDPTARPTTKIVPVGPFSAVVAFLERNRSVLPDQVTQKAVLDNDIATDTIATWRRNNNHAQLAKFEHLANDVKFLPFTPEVGLMDHIAGNVHQFEASLRQRCADHQIRIGAVLCSNRHHRLTGIAISPRLFVLCSHWRGSHVPAFPPVGGGEVAQHRQSHADVRPRRRERFRAPALANNRRQAGVSGLRLHHLLRLSSRSLSALAMQGVRLRFFGDFGHAVRLA
jgi:energy-coupling factor transporter ATP-binding protein EcfA2